MKVKKIKLEHSENCYVSVHNKREEQLVYCINVTIDSYSYNHYDFMKKEIDGYMSCLRFLGCIDTHFSVRFPDQFKDGGIVITKYEG